MICVDVENGVEEKTASTMLEMSLKSLPFACAVTVVPHAFAALEMTEYTILDLIILKHDLPGLNGLCSLKIFRNLNSKTPIVLLLDQAEKVSESIAGQPTFYGILRKPFSKFELCSLVQSVHSLTEK